MDIRHVLLIVLALILLFVVIRVLRVVKRIIVSSIVSVASSLRSTYRLFTGKSKVPANNGDDINSQSGLRTGEVAQGRIMGKGSEMVDRGNGEFLQFYIDLSNNGKARRIWGEDLKRGLKECSASIGQCISVENKGVQTVQVIVPIKDGSGNVIKRVPKKVAKTIFEVVVIS